MNKRDKEYAKILQQMIQYETVSNVDFVDLKKFRGFHKLLKQLFPNVFKKCKVEDFNGSLLIKWSGEKSDSPKMFMNHHDVVLAEGDWLYPPFNGEIHDGKMYGRGTLDTKGGLFSMLKAADELIESGYVPKQDIYFESACTEETTGKGCEAIVEELVKRNIKFDFVLDEGGAITFEPLGGVKATYAMIGLGERGRAALKFVAKSNGGHASTPGKNTPLVRLGKFMAYLEEHNIFEVKVNSIVTEMLQRFAPNVDGAVKYLYQNASKAKSVLKTAMPAISPQAKAMVQTTLAFTMASGSNGSNVLPESAYVIGDMRISHHEGFDKAFEKVKAVASKFDIDVEVFDVPEESNLAKVDSRGFKLMEDAINTVYKDDNVFVAPYIMNQCSDARYMAKVCDTCLRFMPFIISKEQMESIHGKNENVDIENLSKAVDFYKYMMEN